MDDEIIILIVIMAAILLAALVRGGTRGGRGGLEPRLEQKNLINFFFLVIDIL